mmetsp:Transcript_24814/g.17519  ORF Transcript_24814/g.17519 Transcript_24814/m.17519 type:complete len:193 (-) Transcript_24814:601-1179(-)
MVEGQQEIPEKMNSVLYMGNGELTHGEIPVPKPLNDQVLVKVDSAVINQSDMLFCKGKWFLEAEKYPFTPGWEGSGVVVAAGSDEINQSLIGKRVAFTRGSDPNPLVLTVGGCYADYAVTNFRSCVPLPEHISLEEGCSFFVNPLSAIGMVERAQELKAKSVIINAACSQLAKMALKLFADVGITVICIVRK